VCSTGAISVIDELQRILKETTVWFLKILSKHMTGGSEENCDTL